MDPDILCSCSCRDDEVVVVVVVDGEFGME